MRKEKLCWAVGLSLIVLGCLLGAFQYARAQSSPYHGNALLLLQPYREGKTWVFDDPHAGLKREPFVAGIPAILDRLTAGIPTAENGFRLLFSAEPFPEYQIELTWLRAETNGNWYRCEQYQTDGWLCPALGKYFASPPKKLYAKAEPLK